MAHIEGTCDERFEAVRDALAASLDKDDVGASVAVYVDGAPVVDLWGGYADEARTRPWERDTITAVWSTTKTMTALCALILADRGELDLDAPVAAYWPEFAAAGKGDVRVRHVLGHTAGLPSWDEPLTVEQLYDWPAMTALLAAQAPASKPGTVGAYHAVTQGYLAYEVIRRVTGRLLRPVLRRGGGRAAGRRLPHRAGARARPPGRAGHPGHDAGARVRGPWARQPGRPRGGGQHGGVAAGGHPVRQRVRQRAVGGRRAVGAHLGRPGAAVRGRIASGPWRSSSLYEDQVLGARIRYGMGYAVQGRSCSWGGWGGSLVMNDFDRRMTVAYVMNRMLEQGPLGDDRGLSVVLATFG